MVPFHSYIVKVASRCNLNCSYCFIYNLADSSWRGQPHRMSEGTAAAIAERIVEHCAAHQKNDVRLIFHGGEPLLLGTAALDQLFTVFDARFKTHGIDCRYGMQSNGVLLDEQCASWLLRRRVSIGISVDGPPDVNDLHRVDHAGRPSSQRLEQSLQLLSRDPYREIFGGLLSVINIDVDPKRVLDYLFSFSPRSIDLLLPLDNHDRRPQGKEDFERTPYGDWLVEAFEFWRAESPKTRIRIFESIIRTLCGGSSLVESLGLLPVDLVVVETDGSIEGVDSLKGAYEGAAFLGYDVFRNSFDEVANHQMVVARQRGITALAAQCQACPVVRQCGGGYLPHRYSSANQFLNPSIYCRDLERIIRHIHGSVTSDLRNGGLDCTIQSSSALRKGDVDTRVPLPVY